MGDIDTIDSDANRTHDFPAEGHQSKQIPRLVSESIESGL